MKLHRKLAGLVSAAVVLSSLSVGAFAASPSDFADMPSDWSRPALENAINNGLLNGSDGKINASGLLTRVELAAIVNRAFGATKTADISAYTDVPASAWYYADMQKAVHMGTFEGSNGKLSPASAITRQEAFTVLARAFSLADGSASSLSKFSDASAVSSWAKGPVAALTEAGYVNGSGGKLNPTASITRAEFAQIADNLVSAYLPKEYTGTADGNAMVREAGAVLDKADIKGDLILGDGVGDGNVTIKDSKIAGRLVVRGGGVHSIIISGSTEIGTVVVSKVDGNVRVATEGNAKVQTIVVDDGKDDVIIEGTVGKVEIASANVPVVLQNAKVDEVVVSAAGADVTVDKNSTVKTVTVDSAAENTALTVAGKVDTVAVKGDNTTVTAEKGATIAKVQTAAANTEVKGDGKVTKVEAQAGSTGARVTTPGTSITVDKGADAVKTDKGTVEPGKTGSTSGTTTGGGGGGGGGSSTTTETLEGYLPAPLADGAVTDYKVDVTKTSNRDYIDVKVSGTNLQYSLNADTTYHLNDDTTAVGGFWAGVAVPVPEKADAAHTQFSWTAKDWADAETSARAFKAIDGQSYVVVYSDLSMTDKADHLQIVWKDAEGKELSTQKFVLDYSGVTVDKASKPVAVTWTIGEVLVKTDWVRTGTVATLPTDAELSSAGITVPEGQQLVWYLNGEIYKDTAIADTSAIVGVIGSDKFSGGNGTADYPYIVMTADQFAEIASLSEDMKSNALSFKLGADVDLSAVDKTFNIPYFAGSFDGNGHKLTVDKDNYARNTELFVATFNAVFKDLTLNYVDAPYSLIGDALGDSIQFNNVDIEGNMNFGTSNNSTAYIWLTAAKHTVFENCDNHAALVNTDNSNPSKGTWNAVFVGGSTASAISFKNCNNYGDLNMQYASVFYCNSLASGDDATTTSFVFENCHNYGEVVGRKGGSIFTAVSSNYFTGTDGRADISEYTDAYFNADGGSFKIANNHAFTYNISNDTQITWTDTSPLEDGWYVVTLSTPYMEYQVQDNEAVEITHGLGYDVSKRVDVVTGTTEYTAHDLPFGQYKQTLSELPAAIQSKLAEKYQATDGDTLLFEAEARDGDIYPVISGNTTVTIIAFNSGGTPIGYATLAE